MKILFTLLCSLVVNLSGADCNIDDGLQNYSHEVFQCLRSVPLGPDEKNVTISQIKYYLDGYSYRDLVLNLTGPPIGYGSDSINIFKELDRISDLNHENTFDFYQNITQLINSMHCAHAYFDTPCFNSFEILTPYVFRFEIDQVSGRHIAYGQEYESFDSFDEKYQVNIADSEIKYVNILGLDIYKDETSELNEGTYTPEEAIVNWAKDNQGSYRNPYAREEFARSYSFYVRSITRYVVPQSFNITYGYIDHTDNQWKQLIIPYGIYSYGRFTNIGDLCPVNEYYQQSNDSSLSYEMNKSKLREIKKMTKYESKEKQGIMKNFQTIIKRLEKKAQIKIRERNELFWGKKMQTMKNKSSKYDFKSQKVLNNPPTESNGSIHSNNLKYKQQRKNLTSRNADDYIKIYTSKDSSLIGYYIASLKLGIIRIKSFSQEDLDDFQYSLYMIVRQFADQKSPYHSKKILIDLRYNQGGYVRHPYLIFRFLFPQADYPIWPQSDQVRSDINKIYGVFQDLFTKLEIEDSDIFLDDQTGEVIYNYYNLEGSQRTTSVNLADGVQDSITVNLTKRATYYAGHLDKIKEYSLDQQLFRSVHWQPKDVNILVNGYCEGSCAMFAKQVHQKKVGRTVALGNFGGVHNKARYDVGTAGGSGPMNNQYIEQLQEKYLENLDLFIDYDINLDMFPKQFYRKGSFMQISYIELYGVTPETADQLNEFYIYDADFHINHAEQYGNLVLEDEDKDYQMYNRVINELNKKLGNAIQDEQIAQSQINIDSDIVDNETGCIAGEVLINTNGVIEECKSLQDSDIHSVYGYKCSVENYNQRNEITDEILVGQFIKNSNGCKFSHCTAGYMRVGNKCEKEMILFGDTEEYVRPQYLEPVVDTQVDTDTDIEPKKESQWKLILIIIFAAIIAILIVSLITVSVYCSLRKVRVPQKRDNFELQQQIVREQQDNNNIDEQPQQEIKDTDEHKTPDMDMKEPQVKQLDETQKSPDIGQTINEDDDEKEQDGD